MMTHTSHTVFDRVMVLGFESGIGKENEIRESARERERKRKERGKKK